MKLFVCFGGAAVVIDGEAAEVAAGRRGQRRGHRSLSFRGKFLFRRKGGDEKKPLSRASSVASSALLSSAASSLDSDTSSSSSSSSSRSSTASPSPSVSGLLYPPPVKRRQAHERPASPAAGAAAVVLCLLMVVLCGRLGATLLTSAALYLFPRRWPARTYQEKKQRAVGSLECDAASASEAEEETAKRIRAVEGSLVRNRSR